MADIPINALPYTQSPLNKQRADKFLLILTAPKIFRDNDLENVLPKTIQFSVYGSVLPEVSVPSKTLEFAGQSYKVTSYGRTPYSDITVNFTVDNRFLNYYYIYKWLDIMNDDKASLYAKTDGVGFIKSVENKGYKHNSEAEDYMIDFKLYSLDEYNNRIAEFTYTKAFPVNLGSLTYNHRDPSQFDTTFTFSFSQFYMKLLS